MSELQVGKIRSFPVNDNINIGDNLVVDAGFNVTVTNTSIAANGGVTLGAALTCNSNDITGAGAIGCTSVTATGALEGGTLNTGTGSITGGPTTASEVTVGIPTNTVQDKCVGIERQIRVENGNGAATSVTVDSGIVDASNSKVKVDSLEVGGATYDSVAFANFNATQVLKSFGRVQYDANSDSIISSSGFNLVNATWSGSSIIVTWAGDIGTNYTVLCSSTEDGDEPDGSSDDGYQKVWQVTTQTGTTCSFTLINDNNKSGTEALFFLILDADS